MAPVPADLVNRLYAAPPDGFVAARAEAVAAARAAGDAAAAREIGRLRKPTVAAWVVNLLAIRRPELLAELAGLAGELRTAQRDLRGPALRELSARRRAVVAALTAQARQLAHEVDPTPPRLPLAEVESTLHAALSDAELAERVRSGRLLRAASYAGFGEVPRPQLRLVTGGASRTEAGPVDRDGQEAAAPARPDRAEAARSARRRRELDTDLAAARTRQERAAAELAGAVEAERAGAAELAALEAELAALERRRASVEAELRRRKLARRAAERAVAAARRRAGEAEAAVEAFDG
jgi:hypothetical protein